MHYQLNYGLYFKNILIPVWWAQKILHGRGSKRMQLGEQSKEDKGLAMIDRFYEMNLHLLNLKVVTPLETLNMSCHIF